MHVGHIEPCMTIYVGQCMSGQCKQGYACWAIYVGRFMLHNACWAMQVRPCMSCHACWVFMCGHSWLAMQGLAMLAQPCVECCATSVVQFVLHHACLAMHFRPCMLGHDCLAICVRLCMLDRACKKLLVQQGSIIHKMALPILSISYGIFLTTIFFYKGTSF